MERQDLSCTYLAHHALESVTIIIVVIMVSCLLHLLQGARPHIFGMTASPVNTRAKQTQAKVSEAVWQLERNMDAQVITVIDRDPVTAAAPLPELKLLYFVRQHTSDSLKQVEGESMLPMLINDVGLHNWHIWGQ